MKYARALVVSIVAWSAPEVFAQQRAGAVLIVNSSSPRYADAQRQIRPYLDHFGVPYTVLDIATANVGPEIAQYALIVIGHAGLDTVGQYLDATEQANLSNAVNQGSGLVNFDYELTANGTTPRYQYVQDLFGFGYGAATSGEGIFFTSDAPGHYVSSRHGANHAVVARQIPAAALVVPAGLTVLARFQDSGNPALVVTSHGQGRAVQWASYDWISKSILGPLRGLDDIVWRSLAWAARKPFVMQGMPNFLTMRVDDVLGGFSWVRIANEFQMKPWLGLYYKSISEPDAFDLGSLVNGGFATASVHATGSGFFYYDHFGHQNFPDATMASFFQDATAWHSTHGIPISSFVVPHFYEIGTNVFAGLQNWGVKSVGTPMIPGQLYGAPWLMQGPYRLYDAGASDDASPVAYADYLPVPGHPGFANQFFNCLTEIRDDAGYEWTPSATDVPGTIGRGTRQTTRALDAMALATLFTHEYYIRAFTPDDWRAALRGIVNNVASYNPVYVTMDYACQYLRAKHDSKITSSVFDPATQLLTTDVSGSADIATQFYVFTEAGGSILQAPLSVPSFLGSTRVTQRLYPEAAPTLSSIAVTPANPTISAGATQQFSATGTYSNGSTQNVTGQVTWASSNGVVATINSAGMATAVAAGTATIAATLSGINGAANITVLSAPLTIGTTSLPSGIQNGAYSAGLAASGGAPPYTWSLPSGTLPSGLGLSASGVISGTSTATGVFGFTVAVTDAAGSSASSNLGIAVLSPSTLSIWPAAALPGTVDRGADSAVELGVKFQSDVSGSITGIRFYKAATNTGSHVGNLWTSMGTLLASATFSGETASGWQQVNFTLPVPIAAYTTYVASYHTDVGHYSRDLNYFAYAGYDNAPLHALASGVSGGNGVYAYGSSSTFPDGTALAANYWVDVVISTAAAPTLSSVAVTPANPTIAAGATQQFTAIGTYSNGSTQNLTGQVAWASSNGGFATISAAGLATAVAPGTATISATSGTVASTAALTVTPAAMSALTLSPAAVVEGDTSTGTVTLSGPAPAAGATVTLSSNSAAATVPAGVTVPAGASSASFTIGTAAVTATTSATITASLDGLSHTSTLTVRALTVSLSPTSVLGGNNSTGTLTLSTSMSTPFTARLSSSSPSVAVPALVTIASGATTATFPVTSSPVAANTPVIIAATNGSVSSAATLTVTTATFSAISLSPTSVVEGNPSNGTVTLSGPAPAAGATLTLASNNVAATVPASVTVPAGATTATFPIATSAVSAGVNATISATFGATTRSATLAIRAVTLSLSPTAVGGGNTSTATLRLSATVGTATTATLSTSSGAVAAVPATVTISAGATSATFPVSTATVSATTTVAITATYAGIPVSATLSVRAISPSALGLSPSNLAGGAPSTGTVTLNYAAPVGGYVVALTSSRTAAAMVPASVTVPAGSRSATFAVTSYPVTASTASSISATGGGVTQSATLTITAVPAVLSLRLSPTTISTARAATGTVTLNGAAPGAGTTVTLTSNNTAAATVQASVVVPSGFASTTFAITARAVTTATSVIVSAAAGGRTATATLTVNP